MRQIVLMGLSLAAVVWGQHGVTLRQEPVNGREAWVLDNGLIRVAALRGGGHIGEVRLISANPRASINPMRVPHYRTIDPNTYQPSRDDAVYGDGSHRFLSSGYMGHLLCFPFYGPPSSDAEIAAGLGNHGEAPIVEWRLIRSEESPERVKLVYGAGLPKTQYRVERAITMERGKRHVCVEEWVENLAGFDRPFQWMQHATFGPPFVEPGKTYWDVSATRGMVAGGRPGAGSLAADSAVAWPNGTAADGRPVDLRAFQTKEHAGTYYALLMDSSRKTQFFTMYHSGYGVLIGYVFPASTARWIADWQENRNNQFKPWNGEVVARGIEFGNSPFAEGLRKAVERGSLFDVPAYEWIGAGEKRKLEYTIFVKEIGTGFQGVRDARMESGEVVVRER
ncbi:MAG: hypothetical protein R2762_04580 [Bryobacteraceae bacterium]